MKFQMWQFENGYNYYFNYAVVKGISSLHSWYTVTKLSMNRIEKVDNVHCVNLHEKGSATLHVNNIHGMIKKNVTIKPEIN